MTTFTIHLMGQATPITLDLPISTVDDLAEKAGETRYLVGHLASADEDGVCRRVMIATSRIQCAIEA
ncbi:hypothetical protein CD351_09030 [Erythrobacter sp. KY5]|uniref:hypothetical protein n=1 Tax=Erythrobacter sp. KY5 TaxID=2011159 RepID=UPI000DBF3339|nr:hypothetical protein [Erythrobacter sp. KY5]AWW74567.1 hypothetical protein CD351_09030 [Erythrobacter sp. KY5]